MQPSIPSREPVETADFEIVLGRRHIASTGLVLTVLLAVLIGVSYLIGKSAAVASAAETPRPAAIVKPAPAPPPPASPQETATDTAKPAETAAKAPEAAKALAPAKTPEPAGLAESTAPVFHDPIFQDAVKGKTYLQVGVVDKGVAQIWAEGLRTHGLDGIVAPGPSDKVWRVMIGPLADQNAYSSAKGKLDSLGIQNFGKID